MEFICIKSIKETQVDIKTQKKGFKRVKTKHIKIRLNRIRMQFQCGATKTLNLIKCK